VAPERAIDGTPGRGNRRVRTPSARGGRSTAPVAQRLAQQRLAGLFEMTEVRVDQSCVRLSLTREATELPTWLDTLSVPYEVGTERRHPSTHPGPLDVVILIGWSDVSVLARWVPAVAARLETLKPAQIAPKRAPSR
jgi:hypothetical protein